MNKCQLCKKNRDLCDSHIIPSFVYKWIKNTSATGYLRFIKNFNLRVQDGRTVKLLCEDCEGIFNIIETHFSKRIFYPYVNEELDENCVAQGNIKYFKYDDWLLKFIISIHWRIIVASEREKETPDKHVHKINEFENIWRNFLLGERKDTGLCESHIIFLQNMAAGRGNFHSIINEKINYYLLRSTDGTIIFSNSNLGVFSKIGPIAFFTFIKPHKIKNSANTRIKMRGKQTTIQSILNPDIVNFLFINRPNEAMDKLIISDKQQTVIDKSILKNPDRSINSLSAVAFESDLILSQYKNNGKKST